MTINQNVHQQKIEAIWNALKSYGDYLCEWQRSVKYIDDSYSVLDDYRRLYDHFEGYCQELQKIGIHDYEKIEPREGWQLDREQNYLDNPTEKNLIQVHLKRLHYSTDQADIELRELLKKYMKRATIQKDTQLDKNRDFWNLVQDLQKIHYRKKNKGMSVERAASFVAKDSLSGLSARTLANRYSQSKEYWETSNPDLSLADLIKSR